MEMREEQLGGVTALAVNGRLDSTTAPILGQKLEAVVTTPESRLVVDLGHLEYISSAGFRVLLVAAKHADEVGSRLVLCGLSANVRQIFDLAGFLDLFTIAGSRDDAVTAAK
jgi:anti-sigma B factor antagonist